MRLKIDLSEMRFIVKAAPTPKTDFETKEEVVKDGVVQWTVPLMMGDGEEAVELRITVAGDPGLSQLDEVSPVGLTYNIISKGNQSMTWWAAEAVAPAPAPARPAARKGGAE